MNYWMRLSRISELFRLRSDNKSQVKRIFFIPRIDASLLLHLFSCSPSICLPVFARFVLPKPKQTEQTQLPKPVVNAHTNMANNSDGVSTSKALQRGAFINLNL